MAKAETKNNLKKNKKSEVKVSVEKQIKRKKCNFKSWWIIGFLLPPLGLVLYLMWRKNNKDAAKNIGIGALVSTALWLFIGLSFLINTNAEPKKSTEKEPTVSDWIADYNEGNSIVTVIASSTCPHCQNLKPIITASSEKHGYKLYFFEADKLSESDYETLSTTVELEGYEGYVPYIFVIKGKKFNGSHTGEMTDDELTEFLKQSEILK